MFEASIEQFIQVVKLAEQSGKEILFVDPKSEIKGPNHSMSGNQHIITRDKS